MKGKIFLSSILLSSFFFHSVLFSQSGWVQQNSGITQPISKISFIDVNTGWCSSAGGASISSMGYFIRTTNSGLNWMTIITSSTYYNSFHFVDYNTGWIVGGFWNDILQKSKKIFRSTNGGINWNLQYSDSNWGSFISVSFMNYYYGMVVGSTNSRGLVLRTIDAGINWMVDSLDNVVTLNDVYYMYAGTAWAAGGNNGQIIKTTNGGVNWIQQYSASGITFYDIFFYDPVTAWAAGTNGVIAKTTNAGNNWVNQNAGSSVSLSSIWFVTPDIGFAVGGDYYGPAYIFKTTNGGTNWFVNYQQNGYGFKSVHFANNFTGWSAGGVGNPLYMGIIYKTTTGGTIGLQKIESFVPTDFILQQNYPNPFNPATKIRFEIPASIEKGKVYTKMIVCDIMGQHVSELVNEELSPGVYEVEWNATNFSSGVYYYSLQTKEFSQTKKMILIK